MHMYGIVSTSHTSISQLKTSDNKTCVSKPLFAVCCVYRPCNMKNSLVILRAKHVGMHTTAEDDDGVALDATRAVHDGRDCMIPAMATQ